MFHDVSWVEGIDLKGTWHPVWSFGRLDGIVWFSYRLYWSLFRSISLCFKFVKVFPAEKSVHKGRDSFCAWPAFGGLHREDWHARQCYEREEYPYDDKFFVHHQTLGQHGWDMGSGLFHSTNRVFWVWTLNAFQYFQWSSKDGVQREWISSLLDLRRLAKRCFQTSSVKLVGVMTFPAKLPSRHRRPTMGPRRCTFSWSLAWVVSSMPPITGPNLTLPKDEHL